MHVFCRADGCHVGDKPEIEAEWQYGNKFYFIHFTINYEMWLPVKFLSKPENNLRD
jgi:hypothetical protein